MNLEQHAAQLNKKIEKLERYLTDDTAQSQSQKTTNENQVKSSTTTTSRIKIDQDECEYSPSLLC